MSYYLIKFDFSHILRYNPHFYYIPLGINVIPSNSSYFDSNRLFSGTNELTASSFANNNKYYIKY